MDKLDHLIEKYIQNKLTFQEQRQLARWLEEDDENRNTLRNLEIYWNDYSIDLEEKEQRVKAKLSSRIENENSGKQAASFNWIPILKVAAIILLCFTTVLSIYTLSTDPPKPANHIGYIEKKSDPGEKVTINLPDGSTVKLNSGSSIRYPVTFTEDKRVVDLEGEGFFEVERDEKKPFIVNVNKAMIKVLGTSFNVNSVTASNQVIVGVKSGQVKVSNKLENVSRILNPHELVIFDNEDEQMELKNINDEEFVFGWKDQLLVFSDNSANEIFNTLSNWYGVEFILSRNIDNNRVFTSKFENPTLKSVLESLSYVYDFNYEIKENTIIIK